MISIQPPNQITFGQVTQEIQVFQPRTYSRAKKIKMICIFFGIISVAISIWIAVSTIQSDNIPGFSSEQNQQSIQESHKNKIIIQNAQKQNGIIELIYTPGSLKTYSFVEETSNLIKLSGRIQEVSNLTTVHQISILCKEVTETEFNFLIFISKTKIYLNEVLQTEFSGFSSPGDQHNHMGFLQNQDNLGNHTTYDKINEYDHPIFHLRISKNGNLVKLSIPAQIRPDLNQLSYHFFQQIFPQLGMIEVEMTDIKEKNENSYFKSQGGSLFQGKQNSINQSEEEKILRYEEDDEGIIKEKVILRMAQKHDNEGELQGSLVKAYRQAQSKESESQENISFSQRLEVFDGTLKQSIIESEWKVADQAQGTNKENPLIEMLEVNQIIQINLIDQQDQVDEKLAALLSNKLSSMTMLEFNQTEIISQLKSKRAVYSSIECIK